MEALVTGGAGLVGRTLVAHLLSEGWAVTVLDKNPGSLVEKPLPGLNIMKGKVEDEAEVNAAVRGVQVVFHLAESFSSQPLEVFSIDVLGNINLLEACTSAGVEHYIFTSTTRVYGRPQTRPVAEDHPLTPEDSGRPVYALSKYTGERLCLLYQRERSLPVTIFRFWWAFGPELGGKALRSLIDAALANQPLVFPDPAGGNFAHNQDLAAVLTRAARNPRAFGQVYNVASGPATTWQDLAIKVKGLTDADSPLEPFPPERWQGKSTLGGDADVPRLWEIDFNKAIRELGFTPAFSPEQLDLEIEKGLAALVDQRRKK